MLKITHFRSNYSVKLMLTKPQFDWVGLPQKFFQMLYDAMLPDALVNPSHMSIANTTVIGDIYARYNIGGGASSVTLYPDRLEFQFQNVHAPEVALTYDFMRRTQDAFSQTFPSLNYDRVETYSLEHDEITPPGDVEKYLDLFKRPTQAAFADLGEFAEESSGFVHAKAKDQTWECKLRVERSLLLPNGLFAEFSTHMKLGSETTFNDKLAFSRKIATACYAALGLEGEIQVKS